MGGMKRAFNRTPGNVGRKGHRYELENFSISPGLIEKTILNDMQIREMGNKNGRNGKNGEEGEDEGSRTGIVTRIVDSGMKKKQQLIVEGILKAIHRGICDNPEFNPAAAAYGSPPALIAREVGDPSIWISDGDKLRVSVALVTRPDIMCLQETYKEKENFLKVNPSPEQLKMFEEEPVMPITRTYRIVKVSIDMHNEQISFGSGPRKIVFPLETSNLVENKVYWGMKNYSFLHKMEGKESTGACDERQFFDQMA